MIDDSYDLEVYFNSLPQLRDFLSCFLCSGKMKCGQDVNLAISGSVRNEEFHLNTPSGQLRISLGTPVREGNGTCGSGARTDGPSRIGEYRGECRSQGSKKFNQTTHLQYQPWQNGSASTGAMTAASSRAPFPCIRHQHTRGPDRPRCRPADAGRPVLRQ